MIDTHAHLTSDELFFQLDGIISRAKKAGLKKIFNIATDIKTFDRGIELQKREAMIANIAATTPHDVEKEGELFFPIVKEAALRGELIGIGETGLDYFYEHSPVLTQQHYLRKYIELANEVNLPIVIHCREAFADLFKVFDECGSKVPTVLHCFTGTKEEALECVRRGWIVSFSGIVTYKKSVDLRETFKTIPDENIFVETDAPFLAPQSIRGKCNEPAFIVETVEVMAQLKGYSAAKMGQIPFDNAQRIFQF
jgi:TatD DNase family protein